MKFFTITIFIFHANFLNGDEFESKCVEVDPVKLLGKCQEIRGFIALTTDPYLKMELDVGHYSEYMEAVGLNLWINQCQHRFHLIPTFDEKIHSTFLSYDEINDQTLIIADEVKKPLEFYLQNNRLDIFGEKRNHSKWCVFNLAKYSDEVYAFYIGLEFDGVPIPSLSISIKNAKNKPRKGNGKDLDSNSNINFHFIHLIKLILITTFVFNR